jgi:transcription elongation factor GreA
MVERSAITEAVQVESAPTTDEAPCFPNGGDVAVTAEGLALLRSEVDRLRSTKVREVAQELRSAREFGPPTGNDEFWAIREDESVLDARIARLEEVISRARVHVPETTDATLVQIGATVEIEDALAGRRTRYRVVGAHESSDDGAPAVSAASAIGRAIIGQPEGSCVDVTLPTGATRQLRLTRVEGPKQTGARDAQG